MNKQTEAMKLALEALEQYTNVVASVNNPDAWVTVVDAGKPAREAITVLREELAKPDFWEGYVPEPVGAVGSSIKSESPLGCNGPTGPAQQKPDVDRLIELARADEREACAKVADEWSKRRDDVGGYISRNIRARSNT